MIELKEIKSRIGREEGIYEERKERIFFLNKGFVSEKKENECTSYNPVISKRQSFL